MCELFQDLISTYSWCAFGVHFIFAVLMFFIINWIGGNSVSVGYMQMSVEIKEDSAPAFNYIFKVIAPVVFYIVGIAILQNIPNANIYISNSYMSIVYYWAIRIVWVLATGRFILTNWCEMFVYLISSSLATLWVYNIADSLESILPKAESLLEEMWILIILFLYSVLNTKTIGRRSTIKRKNNYITKRYIKFKKRYDCEVNPFFNNDFYEVLTYSIMIYEDFNRPLVVRWIEYVSFFITKKPHTLGVMQITTTKYINNIESVRLGMQKILSDGTEIIQSSDKNARFDECPSSLLYQIAQRYNGGTYHHEIQTIYSYIANKYYNNISMEFAANANNNK